MVVPTDFQGHFLETQTVCLLKQMPAVITLVISVPDSSQ